MVDLVKVEDGCDTTRLLLLDCDENDRLSSNSASPDFSSLDSSAECLPSPITNLPADFNALLQREAPSTCKDPTQQSVALSAYANVPPSGSQDSYPSFRNAESPSTKSPPLASGPAIPLTRWPYKHGLQQPVVSNQHRIADIYSPHTSGRNRVKTVCLLADGMTPFSIHVDALLASHSRRAWLALKMKLCITSVDDICSPSTLHGFAGSVCLSGAWATSGKCITKAYVGSVCISEEIGTLGLSNIEVGRVTAILPDSSLTRCRWLDACGYKL